jgi:CheY-like chemotaxis protein
MESFDGQKTVILAIDDDPIVVSDIVRILGTGGYTCHCCRDLAGAVEQFHAVGPDLVIADLAIAGPNGRRLTEAIRREVGYLDVPMMFLSAAQSPDIIHRHGEVGGTYYLRKPFDVVVLLELVDKALWSSRAALASN